MLAWEGSSSAAACSSFQCLRLVQIAAPLYVLFNTPPGLDQSPHVVAWEYRVRCKYLPALDRAPLESVLVVNVRVVVVLLRLDFVVDLQVLAHNFDVATRKIIIFQQNIVQ